MTALSRGETPGPEISIGKLVNGAKLQDIAAYRAGPDGAWAASSPIRELAPLAARVPAGAAVRRRRCASPAASDEILRNIIAERVLGLPADVRVDKELPFNQLPTGKKK